MTPTLKLLTLFKGVGVLRFTSSLPASVSYSRTGAATALTTAGVVVPFAANAPPITDRGMLLEPAATNLLLRSQEFDNAAWSKVAMTVVADAATAPDGTLTADALTETAATAQHYLVQSAAKAASALTYTGSRYIKQFGIARNVKMSIMDGAGAGADYIVNPTTGALVSGPTYYGGTPFTAATFAVTQVGNGYARVSITATTNTNTGLQVVIQTASGSTLSFAGDASTGFYTSGAQLEVNTFATSYIPTTTAAATRGLPACAVTVPAGKTVARVTYGLSSTVVDITGLTPGASFDLVTGRPWLGLGNELKTLEWRP